MKKEFMMRTITGLLFALIVISIFYCRPLYFTILIIIGLTHILYSEWPLLIKKNYYLAYATLLYPISPLLMLLALNNDSEHRSLIIPLLLSSFCHDTSAYIIGKLFGKHKLAPSISPRKTWQGLLGGFIGTYAMYVFFLFNKVPLIIIALLSIGVTLLATSGDLFESWLKRSCGLKDSGALLPGHGGLLDRIDSTLFLIPLAYMYRTPLLLLFK